MSIEEASGLTELTNAQAQQQPKHADDNRRYIFRIENGKAYLTAVDVARASLHSPLAGTMK